MSKIRVMGMIYACRTKTSRILSVSVWVIGITGDMGLSGYFGTEAQQRLQRKSDRLTPWIMRTPGACLTGRVMCSDDPARLGWDVILENLREDGAFSFRWIDQQSFEEIKRHTEPLSVSFHQWNGFCSDAPTLRRAIVSPLAKELSDGMTVQVADKESVTRLQAFYVDNGIFPLSAGVLLGRVCKARSVLLCDPGGAILAAGFVGMLQNEFSPLHDCAWAGLIASDPQHRGKGLGQRITCEVIRSALDDLGAARVMGFAAPENHVSSAMLQRCGLQASPYASYVTTLSDARFTA